MRFAIIVATAALILPAAAMALEPVPNVAPNPGVSSSSLTGCDGVACVSQPNDGAGGGAAAQRDPAFPFDALSVDDFVCDCPEGIDRLHFWGAYRNEPDGGFDCCDGSFVPVPSFNFFLSVITGPCPDGTSPNLPELPLASEVGNVTYTETQVDLGGPNGCDQPASGLCEDARALFEYCLDLANPIPPALCPAGAPLWIKIQANDYEFLPNGNQWYWGTKPFEHGGCSAAQIFPEAGLEFWTPVTDATGAPLEHEFELLSSTVVPVESATWGSIKNNYRD